MAPDPELGQRRGGRAPVSEAGESGGLCPAPGSLDRPLRSSILGGPSAGQTFHRGSCLVSSVAPEEALWLTPLALLWVEGPLIFGGSG